MDLAQLLHQIGTEDAARFLEKDPLRFPRGFRDPRDQEIAAFFSALLAYGRADMIGRSLEDLFSRMPEGPSAFVAKAEAKPALERLSGFKHRFNDGRDLAALALILRRLREEAGSLESFFLRGDDGCLPHIGAALSRFCDAALSVDLGALYGRARGASRGYLPYLFPSPERGSACKRLCMLMRWLCRKDDGVDLGLWTKVDPSRLVIPLDTHTARISRLVGLSRRRTADWKMALEVTCALKRYDARDPVRYDFALAHLGISDGCRGKAGPACPGCALRGFCPVQGLSPIIEQ